MKEKILIATRNKGKVKEIGDILTTAGATGITFLQPDDLNISGSPDETGDDYETNSIIKARFYGERSGLLTIADDSGLEVHTLDGFPGIKSARLESYENSDKSRYETLLEMMSDVAEGDRHARFVCCASAYFPNEDKVIAVTEYWEGIILESAVGTRGFGYDPIFFDPVVGKVSAELSTEEKNRISHRGKAIKKLWDKLIFNINL
ncbi:MAG: RdgB/HAM1 family non-canonical purine NTP pyrophosphatase [bacterium]